MRAPFVVAVLGLALLVGCGGGGSREANPPAETATAVETVGRQPTPHIEGVTLDGEELSLAELRGRPLFVNVWSSW